MPKISALPNLIAAAADDELPIHDLSTTSTKKMTLTVLKEWLQSLTGWVTPSMRTGVVKAGSFTITANGAKAVTGVGFQPKAVLLFSAIGGGSAASSSRGMAMGVMDATSQGAIHQSDREANGSSSEIYTNKVLELATIAAGGGSYTADPTVVYTSMDADGFTVTVSNYSTSRTVIYLAIA